MILPTEHFQPAGATSHRGATLVVVGEYPAWISVKAGSSSSFDMTASCGDTVGEWRPVESGCCAPRAVAATPTVDNNTTNSSVIPKNQYDKYANIRPTIRIKESGTNAGIELDTTLGVQDQTLLHPNLQAFKELWDEGKLNIVHGVGYPQLNKSHFSGRALMSKGGDGTDENSNKPDGWMARYLHSAFDHTTYQDPLGIQLGNKKPADEFHSDAIYRAYLAF